MERRCWRLARLLHRCWPSRSSMAIIRSASRRLPRTAIGLLGSGGVLVFVILLLRPYELGFSVKAGATYRALWEQGVLEQPMVDIALAEAFEERRNDNAVVVRRLVSFLALTLVAVVLETAGLATAAALASWAWLPDVGITLLRRLPSRPTCRPQARYRSCPRRSSISRRRAAQRVAAGRGAPEAASWESRHSDGASS